MKKIFKIIGKIIKGYFVFDIICLAVVGAGELIEEYENNPEYSILDNNETVLRRTYNRFKKWLGLFL